jgi:hypothetical protein
LELLDNTKLKNTTIASKSLPSPIFGKLLFLCLKKNLWSPHPSFDTLIIMNFHFIPNLNSWVNNIKNDIVMNLTHDLYFKPKLCDYVYVHIFIFVTFHPFHVSNEKDFNSNFWALVTLCHVACTSNMHNSTQYPQSTTNGFH